jgi:hypothetical protein
MSCASRFVLFVQSCWMLGLDEGPDVTRGILGMFVHISSVNREMSLLNLINLSLLYVYCSTTSSNYELIRLKKFVLQISLNLCI